MDYDVLRPNFGWAPTDIIKPTIKKTIQFTQTVEQFPFKKHFKTCFPDTNIFRCNKVVATDTVYCDIPAIDQGVKSAQTYVGMDSMVTNVYPMKSDKEIVSTLKEHIQERGAKDKLISNKAQLTTSG